MFCGEPIVREFNLEPSATSQTQWVKPFLKQSAAGYRRTKFGGGCWLQTEMIARELGHLSLEEPHLFAYMGVRATITRSSTESRPA